MLNIDIAPFWAYIIKKKFEDEAKKAPGGTIKTITKEVLSDFNLMLPCYAEQSKVADYLITLDNLITLHHRKLIFFKKNLINDWEQRKVSDITTSYSGGTSQAGNAEYYNGDISFIRADEI